MKNKSPQLFKVLGMLLAFAVLFSPSTPSAADSPYPSKPVRLIIPFPPGGSNDIVGRLIATKLTERLGKQVVVDNRGGAGGVLASEITANAAPDGYTLLIISAAFVSSPAFYQLPFDSVKSFAPVARLATQPNVLAVNPSVPANSVKEFIALAKRQPGKLVCASSGGGGFNHLATELFKMMADIDIKIVHFKGGGPGTIDVLGGHSQFTTLPLMTSLPHIKSGKLRALGVGGKRRSSVLPDVPTISEAGVPGYEAPGWWGILAPAGAPAPIVDRLNKELKALLSTAEVKKLFLNEGADVDYMGPAEFGQFIEKEIIKWGKVVKEANIKVE